MSKKLNTETFISRSKAVHGDKYNYDKSVYVNATVKIIITCPIHGDFETLPYNHYAGNTGCKHCGYESQSNTKKRTTADIISEFQNTHGTYYDYSKVKYTGSKHNVSIICPVHGEFLQNPQSHINGMGCKKCSTKYNRKSTKQFVAECKERFPEYDYNHVSYVNNYTPVELICNKHGSFHIAPKDLLFYHRSCPKCNPTNSVSAGETAWLNSLGIKCRQHRITMHDSSFIVADGYDPATNTVYEYWGDFWHGNPDVFPSGNNARNQIPFATLYKNTVDKKIKIIESGFNLVDIWESDFNSRSS